MSKKQSWLEKIGIGKKEQVKADAEAKAISAKNKLKVLGLTDAEIEALIK